MSYSTLATLPDGNIGLLYEPDNGIRFATFNLAWLGGVCASVEIDGASGHAGEVATVQATVTNQMGTALQDASLELDLPSGWSAEPITVDDVAAGEQVTVSVPVHVPEGAYAGKYELTATLQTDQGSASTQFGFTVAAAQDDLVTIVPQLTDPPETAVRGASLGYSYTVQNVGEQTVSLVPSSADLTAFTRPGEDNCGWQSLEPGQSYTCTTARHVLTEDDLTAGEFAPSTT